ncbi:MAG: hypothetical protein OXI41_09100 [Chloroflexota bacterium]|nr:hypothetical protein [Chloroflexota bacterium]MDE2896599.1 hypothetical protein [Chloroflexota bacterium]
MPILLPLSPNLFPQSLRAGRGILTGLGNLDVQRLGFVVLGYR